MPKHFQAEEKEKIYHRLIEEGKKSWERYGIKRTSVEDVCKAVGISKGSFYSFFDSKELYFMEILETSEKQIKESLMDVVLNQGGSAKERFINALNRVFEEARRKPWLIALMGNKGEYKYLIRKLPQERVEKHIVGDDEDTEKFMLLLGLDTNNIDTKIISAALRGLFFIMMHEQEVGEEHIDTVFKLLVEGLAERIFGRE